MASVPNGLPISHTGMTGDTLINFDRAINCKAHLLFYRHYAGHLNDRLREQWPGGCSFSGSEEKFNEK
uniref:Uncharacterized protein n=1 Tax=Peronospora matthiolae TaxID=2874970 RepID=A0AAV1TFT3_9STRA